MSARAQIIQRILAWSTATRGDRTGRRGVPEEFTVAAVAAAKNDVITLNDPFPPKVRIDDLLPRLLNMLLTTVINSNRLGLLGEIFCPSRLPVVILLVSPWPVANFFNYLSK